VEEETDTASCSQCDSCEWLIPELAITWSLTRWPAWHVVPLYMETYYTDLLMNLHHTPKLGQSGLLYRWNLHTEKKWAWIGIFKPA